jgi:hypothetical protein
VKTHCRLALVAIALPLALTLPACQPGAPGPAGSHSPSRTAAANLAIVNDGHTRFDQDVKNAIADVQDFWRKSYPEVSGGKPYPELRGGIYSVDGAKLTDALKRNACLRQDPEGAR